MVIKGAVNPGDISWIPWGNLSPSAQPIHLHGHDFAVLEQSESPYQGPKSLNLTLNIILPVAMSLYFLVMVTSPLRSKLTNPVLGYFITI
ncbi:hypothetical protein P170DRAFT_437580 [Aspergillus steynii IBT 23096]|uniref:Plastocyanin-like domain-containing protein n=1 Tax=Aspergillus steynii IBT 23096 TaxID=1392250 RepID=A0A2I2G4Q8_9EURO|nr:uncharacterized protein P170DRAFT_437580 [Aspergillus steynii IBT 23096]PLB47859.1 hypothetical protein P170DRAFT_437580 [Aspergillus steynii IBT 23096]